MNILSDNSSHLKQEIRTKWIQDFETFHLSHPLSDKSTELKKTIWDFDWSEGADQTEGDLAIKIGQILLKSNLPAALQPQPKSLSHWNFEAIGNIVSEIKRVLNSPGQITPYSWCLVKIKEKAFFEAALLIDQVKQKHLQGDLICDLFYCCNEKDVLDNYPGTVSSLISQCSGPNRAIGNIIANLCEREREESIKPDNNSRYKLFQKGELFAKAVRMLDRIKGEEDRVCRIEDIICCKIMAGVDFAEQVQMLSDDRRDTFHFLNQLINAKTSEEMKSFLLEICKKSSHPRAIFAGSKAYIAQLCKESREVEAAQFLTDPFPQIPNLNSAYSWFSANQEMLEDFSNRERSQLFEIIVDSWVKKALQEKSVQQAPALPYDPAGWIRPQDLDPNLHAAFQLIKKMPERFRGNSCSLVIQAACEKKKYGFAIYTLLEFKRKQEKLGIQSDDVKYVLNQQDLKCIIRALCLDGWYDQAVEFIKDHLPMTAKAEKIGINRDIIREAVATIIIPDLCRRQQFDKAIHVVKKLFKFPAVQKASVEYIIKSLRENGEIARATEVDRNFKFNIETHIRDLCEQNRYEEARAEINRIMLEPAQKRRLASFVALRHLVEENFHEAWEVFCEFDLDKEGFFLFLYLEDSAELTRRFYDYVSSSSDQKVKLNTYLIVSRFCNAKMFEAAEKLFPEFATHIAKKRKIASFCDSGKFLEAFSICSDHTSESMYDTEGVLQFVMGSALQKKQVLDQFSVLYQRQDEQALYILEQIISWLYFTRSEKAELVDELFKLGNSTPHKERLPALVARNLCNYKEFEKAIKIAKKLKEVGNSNRSVEVAENVIKPALFENRRWEELNNLYGDLIPEDLYRPILGSSEDETYTMSMPRRHIPRKYEPELAPIVEESIFSGSFSSFSPTLKKETAFSPSTLNQPPSSLDSIEVPLTLSIPANLFSLNDLLQESNAAELSHSDK